MDPKTEVTLIAPAKVGGKFRAVGAVVEVDATELQHLKKAGAVPDDKSIVAQAEQADAPDALMAQLAAAIAKADEQALALAEIEAELGELATLLGATEARAVEAEAQRDMLQDRVLELQKDVGEAVLRAEAAEAGKTNEPPASPEVAPAKSKKASASSAKA